MPDSPNKLSQFRQELKRRKVVRVITVYAATAFVILELLSIIIEPLRLPEWTLQFAIVFLCIGFVIAVILSWIYDIHPEGGIVKTDSAHKVKAEDTPTTSSRWKIASYISFIVIVVLVVINIIPRTGKKESLEKSIAVLPFAWLSDDPEKRYQADGVMDAILLHLCKIEDLRVMSRTSVEQYRDTDKTIPEICEELGVAYILEGSFQKDGNQARLIVQLIQSGKEGHVWGNNYDRDWKEIFSVQSEVAQAVAEALKAVITPEEKKLIEKVPTTNLTAFDYYQRGREEYWRAILYMEYGATLDRAEYFLKKALEQDPAFALAYSGLALIQFSKYYVYIPSGPLYIADYYQSEKLDSVSILAEKALAIDSQIADAYYAKGRYEYEKGNFREAMISMQNALAIDPNHTAAMVVASDISAALFDYVTALELLNKAAGMERGSMLAMIDFYFYYTFIKIGFPEQSLLYLNEYLSHTGDSIQYYILRYQLESVQGNFESAFDYIKDAYAIDSSHRDVIMNMGNGLLNLERYEEAYPFYSIYVGELEASSEVRVYEMKSIGYELWMLGKKEEAMCYFQETIEHCTRHIQIKSDYGQSRAIFDKAGIYAFLGEKDSAYYYLEDLVKVRWHKYYISMMKSLDPMFESIRHEERFQELLRKMEGKYQSEHERVRKWMEEHDML
ncbi:MAG: tetratricopeptide repeat protein [Bacteroidia bacterium]|nr:MAG: tetratricopeptide repeat protein [Bacteroidia bacterium]